MGKDPAAGAAAFPAPATQTHRAAQRHRAVPARGPRAAAGERLALPARRRARRARRQGRADEHLRAGLAHRRKQDQVRRPVRPVPGSARRPGGDWRRRRFHHRLLVEPQGRLRGRLRGFPGFAAEPRVSRGQNHARQAAGKYGHFPAQRQLPGHCRARSRQAGLRRRKSLRPPQRIRHRGRGDPPGPAGLAPEVGARGQPDRGRARRFRLPGHGSETAGHVWLPEENSGAQTSSGGVQGPQTGDVLHRQRGRKPKRHSHGGPGHSPRQP